MAGHMGTPVVRATSAPPPALSARSIPAAISRGRATHRSGDAASFGEAPIRAPRLRSRFAGARSSVHSDASPSASASARMISPRRRSPCGKWRQNSSTVLSGSMPMARAYSRMKARAKIPDGHREKSFRSNAAHMSTSTLVRSARCSSAMPRCSRMRRRLGPKRSCPFMAGSGGAKGRPALFRRKRPVSAMSSSNSEQWTTQT